MTFVFYFDWLIIRCFYVNLQRNTFLDKTMEEYGELVRHSPKFSCFKSTDIVKTPVHTFLTGQAGIRKSISEDSTKIKLRTIQKG